MTPEKDRERAYWLARINWAFSAPWEEVQRNQFPSPPTEPLIAPRVPGAAAGADQRECDCQ